MKKSGAILIMMLGLSSLAWSQNDLPKESKIQKNNIKSLTISKSDFETGKEDKYTQNIGKYNDKGQLVEYYEWDDKKKFVKHEKYEYNEDGEKVKETQYNAAGAVQKINEYKYQGKLLKEKISYLPNGKIKSKKVYMYEFFQ